MEIKIVQNKLLRFVFVILLSCVATVLLAQNSRSNLYLFYDKTDSLIVKREEGATLKYLFYDEKQIERKNVLLKKSIFLPEGFREYVLFIGKNPPKSVRCRINQKKELIYRKELMTVDFRNYTNIYIIEDIGCGYYRKIKVFFEPSL